MVWTSDATRYILPGRGHGIRPKKCWKNYISWPTWEHPIVVPDELKEVLSCGPDKWKKLHGWMDGKVILKKPQITMTLMPMMCVCKLLNATENVNSSFLIFFQE